MSTQTQSRTASRFSAKTLTMCAIFTALVAVCSQITIPLPIIPINLALFAVYLAGALLGPWRGALSLLVYLLLAAVGVPVRAGRRRLASSAASRIFTTSQGRNGTTQAEKLAKNGVPERMEYHRVPKK